MPPRMTKAHHSDIRHPKMFWGRGIVSSPDPSPIGRGTPLPTPHPSWRLRRLDSRKNARYLALWGRLGKTTAPCFTFLERVRRADVKLYLTCDAATCRFRDIRGQTAKSVSDRPEMVHRKPFLTPHLETPKDVATERG